MKEMAIKKEISMLFWNSYAATREMQNCK